MGNAEALKNLAEEMASAYQERVNSILAIKQGTAHLLADFGKAHQEMANNLRTELAKVKPELNAAESDRKASDQAEIKERKDSITTLLDDFDKAHKEMADKLRAELAKVKPELQGAESDRKASDQAEIKERNDYIEKLLGDFGKAHQEMADNLRTELAKFKSDMDTAESDRKASDQAEIRERKWAISSMLDDFKNDREKATAAWRELVATMQSAKSRPIEKPVTVEEAIEEPVEEAEEEEPEEEMAEKAGIEEEEAIAKGAAEEEIEEDLGGRILDFLEDHTEGMKMTQVADMLGIENWRTLIPIMRELLDDGEIRKEDTLYFASE